MPGFLEVSKLEKAIRDMNSGANLLQDGGFGVGSVGRSSARTGASGCARAVALVYEPKQPIQSSKSTQKTGDFRFKTLETSAFEAFRWLFRSGNSMETPYIV